MNQQDNNENDCPLCKRYSTPNKETLEAIKEPEEGKGIRVNSVEELMAELNKNDESDE